MRKTKIAIYVEGQTEQILLNFLIKIWWNFSGIRIQNLKILAGQYTPCPIKNFSSPDELNAGFEIFFLIIDVGGEGSLPSAIAGRSKTQHETGFKIIGLRDLYAQDFENLPINIDRVNAIKNNFKKALLNQKCHEHDTIDVYFAIMEIEGWLLGFTKAVSAWAKIDEVHMLSEVSKTIKSKNINFEMIKRPSVFLNQLGAINKKQKSKSFNTITSIASKITRADIEELFANNQSPSFNKFWSDLLLFCK